MKKTSWQNTQNQNYFDLVEHRIQHVDLTWVSQFLELIGERYPTGSSLSVKDIGCQALQFYKQLSVAYPKAKYFGYELEQKYVDLGLKYFPDIADNIVVGDFLIEPKIMSTNISVCSATLEHVDRWPEFLQRMLTTTTDVAILRAFSGNTTERRYVLADGAKEKYAVWQFSLEEIMRIFHQHGFSPRVVRDQHTDSLPIFIPHDGGFTRTQHIIVGTKLS